MPTPGFIATRRPGLAVAGLAGGLLSTVNPLVRIGVSPDHSFFLLGVWLGLALCGYFLIVQSAQPTARPLLLIALSVAAWGIAYMAAAAIEMQVMRSGAGNGSDGPRLHAQALVAGGSIGALVLSASTFFLFIDRRSRAILAVAICAAAGGVLGVAGYELGRALQPGYPREEFTTSVLFVVWQTGMGAAMAAAWPVARGDQAVARDRESGHVPIPVIAKVLMIAVMLPLGWMVLRSYQAGRLAAAREAARKAFDAERPPVTGLPAVTVRPNEEMVVLTPIANLRVKTLPPYRVAASERSAERVDYLGCYSNVGGDECAAIEVRVVDYPTPIWAKYALRQLLDYEMSTTRLETVPVSARFNQRVVERRIAGQGVFWLSGTRVVRITSSFLDIDAVVRAYLERHPSSL